MLRQRGTVLVASLTAAVCTNNVVVVVTAFPRQQWTPQRISAAQTKFTDATAASSSSTARFVAATSFLDSPMDESGASANEGNMNRLLDERLFEIDFTEVDRADAETELLVSRRLELLRNRFVANTAGTYRFQLPLKTTATAATATRGVSSAASSITYGMTVAEVNAGLLSDRQLDMDTMRVTSASSAAPALKLSNVDAEFNGLVVTFVRPDSPAGKAGVVAGDVLTAVSATIGDAVSSVSTFGAIQAALSSRKLFTSGSVTLELRRLGNVVAGAAAENGATATTNVAVGDLVSTSQYELTLTRPLGFSIGESANDGYVVVTAIKDRAVSNLVRHAVQIGDRVVAIDSSLGSKLWPVSTVEGAISAVTGRMPGQAVTIRFERPITASSSTTTVDNVAASAVSMSTTARATSKDASVAVAKSPVSSSTANQKELIQRCREVLKRYLGKESEKRNSAVLRMSAQVADKVVDALACASATIDSVTLSMIMNAYLQCHQAKDAIRIFESTTGFSGDGSSNPVKEVITGKTGGCIVPSESSLNLYTGTALIKAHGEMGDYYSVARVLAALEGRSGEVDDVGLESAPWPWTGAYGTIQPDTICYNVALAAAEKSGGLAAISKALELFERMTDSKKADKQKVKMGPVRNEITYNTMISALCNVDRPEKAFALFEQMRRVGLRPDKFTYTSLIRVCLNEGDITELIYDMRESGAKPDVVTYNTMIQSLCRKRQLTHATKLVTEMESRGIAPDSRTYGALMNGLLQAGKPSACLTLFEAACSNSRTSALTENVHLYTSAISAASVLGDHERALELVSRMKANGVKPNLKTLTAVMGACLACKKPELAAQLYRKIERPDGYATRQGIRAFCGSGDVESAVAILEAEKRRGAKLLSGRQIMASYENVLDEALVQRKYSLACRAFQDLLDKGYIPSSKMFQTMMGALDLDDRTKSLTEPASVALEKFRFLLFVMDALQRRRLPIESDIYVGALTLGARLDGLPRMVALLLTRAKTAINVAKEEFLTSKSSLSSVDATFGTGAAATAARIQGWEFLLDHYESFPNMSLTTERLPMLPVRVAPRDTLRILRVEQSVTNGQRRKVR